MVAAVFAFKTNCAPLHPRVRDRTPPIAPRFE
jgi:hypothetical protein